MVPDIEGREIFVPAGDVHMLREDIRWLNAHGLACFADPLDSGIRYARPRVERHSLFQRSLIYRGDRWDRWWIEESFEVIHDRATPPTRGELLDIGLALSRGIPGDSIRAALTRLATSLEPGYRFLAHTHPAYTLLDEAVQVESALLGQTSPRSGRWDPAPLVGNRR